MYPRHLLQAAVGGADGAPVETVQFTMGKDFKAIVDATGEFGQHFYHALTFSLGIDYIFQFLAVIAAIYLFIIDRTNWRTNILTSLLVPYIALNLPIFIFNFIRSEIGLWIAFVLVVIRLFVPKQFPDELNLPGALILLLVTAPSFIAHFRISIFGYFISLFIGIYLAYEHISHAGGFKGAVETKGLPVTIGIILLFIAPAWWIIWYWL